MANVPAADAFTSHSPNHLSLDHYWLVINMAWQRSNRNEILAKWIEDHFELKIVNIFSERLGDQIGINQPLRVLGVGSGAGYQEMLQMKILKSNFSQISATVIEPCTEQITKYQDAVAKSCDLDGVDYDWQIQTFQQYFKSPGAKQKYHFITVVDAIYFVGEVEEGVRNLYELLEPGGMILIILVTEHTGFGKFWKYFPNLKRNPGTSESLAGQTNYTNSADVKSVLTKHRIAYTQFSYTQSLDATPCFTDSDTIAARLLLDNITLIKNCKESLPDEVFNRVMDFLKHNTRFVKSDQGGDTFYFDTKSDIILISK
ncbi:histamine N-methyltransferase-like [Amphiura filiformis]|uniref:histamine N-methyltransferase-like n=1 Tax=Amphiura filiformis TaxID=82378 RepID=UPI003B20EF3D